MHIAFITPAYLPLPGGGERYVASLADHLADAGHQISVITSCAATESDFWLGCSTTSIAMAPQKGVTVRRAAVRALPAKHTGLLAWRRAMVTLSALPGNQSGTLFQMARLMPWLQGLDEALDSLQDVDIVHAFNVSWEAAMVVAYRFAQYQLRPFVITPFAHFATGLTDRVARNSTMDHQMTMLRDAGKVLVLTSNEQDGLIQLGVSPERIGIIGGGLDPLPENIELSPYAAGGAAEPDKPFALFIGRASIDKGAIHAVEAVRSLNQQGSPVPLVMVGSPTPEFSRYYQGLSAEDRGLVRHLGRLEDADKHALLQSCSMLLLPSRSESLGIVVLEAWAHGRPVIGAQAGALPEVIEGGKDGLLVPYGDVDALAAAIDRLSTDDALAEQLGAAGREKVYRDYQWTAVADRVLAHYDGLLVRSPASS